MAIFVAPGFTDAGTGETSVPPILRYFSEQSLMSLRLSRKSGKISGSRRLYLSPPAAGEPKVLLLIPAPPCLDWGEGQGEGEKKFLTPAIMAEAGLDAFGLSTQKRKLKTENRLL